MQAIVPLIGVGLGLWATSQMAKSQQNAYNSAISSMQNTSNAALETMPEVPTNPTLEAATPEESVNPEAAQAATDTTQAAAAAQAKFNPTGGMGLTGTTVGKKQTLAGV